MVAVAGNEKLRPERVTQGKAKKREPGTLKTITEHLPFILADRWLDVQRSQSTLCLGAPPRAPGHDSWHRSKGDARQVSIRRSLLPA